LRYVHNIKVPVRTCGATLVTAEGGVEVIGTAVFDEAVIAHAGVFVVG
jgi:ribosomal protein S27E